MNPIQRNCIKQVKLEQRIIGGIYLSFVYGLMSFVHIFLYLYIDCYNEAKNLKLLNELLDLKSIISEKSIISMQTEL